MSESLAEFQALVRRARNGSAEAVREVVAAYGPFILKVVRRRLGQHLRVRYDSQDFEQMVWASFYALSREQYAFETPEQLGAFLAALARNKVADAARRAPAAAGAEVAPDEVPARQPTPSQVAAAEERWDRLVAGLTPEHRRVLNLLRQGHSHAEIARELRLSTKLIQRLLRRLEPELAP